MVSADEIAGLIHTIGRDVSEGQISLEALGESIGYDEQRLLDLLDLLERLDLAKLVTGRVEMTSVGRCYARASGHARRRIFADQVTDRIPFVKRVQDKISEKP